MKAAVIAFTRRGAELGEAVARHLDATLHVPPRLAPETGAAACGSLEAWTAEAWQSRDALIFIGACGIAVRAIAPHVQDKFTDPAVVVMDEGGRFVIPLLSGHVGGANALAAALAEVTGGQAVISTATDVTGRFAVDVWAREQGLAITDRQLAKAVSAAILENEAVGFASDFDHACPPGLRPGRAELGVWVTCRSGGGPFPRTLRLVPRRLVLGIGCRRGIAKEAVAAAVDAALEMAGLDPLAAAVVATISLKAEEPGLLEFCREQGFPLQVYSAEELAAVPGAFTASSFVRSVTGVDNVCERAAAARGGTLLLDKQALEDVTVAIALADPAQWPDPHVFENVREKQE